MLVGAALLAGVASISVSALPPQAKSTPEAKQAAPAKKKSSKSAKKRSARARRQMVPTPERIKEIQTALAGQGYYEGEPTGKWDARSVEAMKKFQEANGFAPTGKLDAKSLQKLGLGSEVAGAAAPRPPANELRPQPPRE